ncbi:hypothetical protein JXL21_05050 [Candidatus Bathyarchaeota archaeon]|nr:hypothetical protein [Candidatus Bathyarchaeota archaeon]
MRGLRYWFGKDKDEPWIDARLIPKPLKMLKGKVSRLPLSVIIVASLLIGGAFAVTGYVVVFSNRYTAYYQISNNDYVFGVYTDQTCDDPADRIEWTTILEKDTGGNIYKTPSEVYWVKFDRLQPGERVLLSWDYANIDPKMVVGAEYRSFPADDQVTWTLWPYGIMLPIEYDAYNGLQIRFYLESVDNPEKGTGNFKIDLISSVET